MTVHKKTLRSYVASQRKIFIKTENRMDIRGYL